MRIWRTALDLFVERGYDKVSVAGDRRRRRGLEDDRLQLLRHQGGRVSCAPWRTTSGTRPARCATARPASPRSPRSAGSSWSKVAGARPLGRALRPPRRRPPAARTRLATPGPRWPAARWPSRCTAPGPRRALAEETGDLLMAGNRRASHCRTGRRHPGAPPPARRRRAGRRDRRRRRGTGGARLHVGGTRPRGLRPQGSVTPTSPHPPTNRVRVVAVRRSRPRTRHQPTQL